MIGLATVASSGDFPGFREGGEVFSVGQTELQCDYIAWQLLRSQKWTQYTGASERAKGPSDSNTSLQNWAVEWESCSSSHRGSCKSEVTLQNYTRLQMRSKEAFGAWLLWHCWKKNRTDFQIIFFFHHLYLYRSQNKNSNQSQLSLSQDTVSMFKSGLVFGPDMLIRWFFRAASQQIKQI